MEFLEIIITTGVLIFAMTIIQNKKRKAQDEKQHIDLEENTNIISSSNTSNDVNNHTFSDIDKVRKDNNHYFTNTKASFKTNKKKNTSKSHSEEPKTEQNRADEPEFDLKKAVVYAEILRPKFKDDEI